MVNRKEARQLPGAPPFLHPKRELFLEIHAFDG